MTERPAPLLTATLLALGTGCVYLPLLQNAPLYLNRDEVFFALTAHSVASTGRDPHGLFLPLFFQITVANLRPMWFEPLLMYAITLAQKVLPFSEATIRLPMAFAGILDVVLMYSVGRLLFKRELFAVAGAVLLALTPAHFMFSRVAMDFQMPLPFVLGWAVCLLTYLKRNDSRTLFAAGLLLGVGLYSYIAAMMMMPIYWLLSCAVLYRRGDPLRRLAIFTAGFVIPALLAVPFLLNHPSLVRDVASHYQPLDAPNAGALGQFMALMSPSRLAGMAAAYWTFWNPRFLFINGPSWTSESTWQVGVFLLPVAGLLIVGVARALRHPGDPKTILLVGGLLSAPLPGSLVGEPEAIRRVLELLPFGVLLAVFGFEYLAVARTSHTRLIAFTAIWVTALALTVASHEYVPRAQAYVRAATVPLAVAGLALFLDRLRIDHLERKPLVVIAMVSVLVMQIARAAGAETLLAAALVGVLAFATLFGATITGRSWTFAVVALVAALSSLFTNAYVDYFAHRVAFIPASAIIFAMRLVLTSVVAAACIAVVVLTRRGVAGRAVGAPRSWIAMAAVVIAQIAYFYVDWFTDLEMRGISVALVAASIVAAAALMQRLADPARLARVAGAAVIGLVCVQFTYFYVDYFNAFQARRSSELEGNVRDALAIAIERARDHDVPLLYIERIRAELGGGALSGLGRSYATFYLLKAHREDLIDRTVEGDDGDAFDPDRIRQLRTGSIVIATPSGPTDQAIKTMIDAGVLKLDAFVKAPDGTPTFWVLERIGPLAR